MLMGSADCAIAAAAVACAPVVARANDNCREDAPEDDVAALALVADIDNSSDEAADVGAALDAAVSDDEDDEELAAAEEVTALCATGAALELSINDDTAALETVLDTAADEAGDTEATVCKVVAAIEAGLAAAAALFGNDPSPQRHEQSQDPSELVVPLPLAKAPGEPTAGAAAIIMLVSSTIRMTSKRQLASWTSCCCGCRRSRSFACIPSSSSSGSSRHADPSSLGCVHSNSDHLGYHLRKRSDRDCWWRASTEDCRCNE